MITSNLDAHRRHLEDAYARVVLAHRELMDVAVDARRAGLSFLEIYARGHVIGATLRRVMGDGPLPRPTAPRRDCPTAPHRDCPAFHERNVKAARRIAAGETLQAVASDIGVSRERVRQIALAQGVKPSSDARRALIRQQKAREKERKRRSRLVHRGLAKQRQVEELSKLWCAGFQVEDIAAAYGTKASSMYVRISRLREHYPKLFPRRGPGGRPPGKLNQEPR